MGWMGRTNRYPVDVWLWTEARPMSFFVWCPRLERGICETPDRYYWQEEEGVMLAKAVVTTGDGTTYGALLDWMREHIDTVHEDYSKFEAEARVVRLRQRLSHALTDPWAIRLDRY